MRKKIVVALGGNAIISKNEKETYSNLIKNIKKTCENIVNLVKNNEVTIVHGNGSEIGYLLLQNEIARKKVPVMPLDILGAETEGFLGYLIQEQLFNVLKKERIKKKIVTIITQTLVSKKDSAFKNPTKFIGQFYTKKQSEKLKNKFLIEKDSNKGFRRVVPSPKPIKIIESEIIKKLVNENFIVVASGGGGIPVILEKNKLKGVEAVIDKDLSASILGREIKAELLLIITDIDKVYLNYGTKHKRELRKLSIKDAKKYLKMGQFPNGSMGPKIEAAINFLDKPFEKSLKGKTKKVIICNIENIKKALNGKEGTIIE